MWRDTPDGQEGDTNAVTKLRVAGRRKRASMTVIPTVSAALAPAMATTTSAPGQPR